MRRLIKLQLRNIFHQKFYYIFMTIFILTGPILNFVGVVNTPEYSNIKIMPEIVIVFNGAVDIICSIFIAMCSCFDFNEGTTKNIIGRGYTRKQLLFSKYVASLIGVFGFVIATSLVICMLFGINGLGFESSMILALIESVCSIIACTIFITTLSFILEKNTSAILACLFAPLLLQGGLALLDSKLKLDISQYWVENISSRFTANPTLANLGCSIAIYAVYIAIFIIVGKKVIKNKEIK